MDAETLLTDGGNLAMPVRRESMRLRKGASRAIYKLKEKIAKFKVPRPGKKKYRPQIDDDTTSEMGMPPVVCAFYRGDIYWPIDSLNYNLVVDLLLL